MEDKKLIINVGRQFGSGGKLVALALGKKLGIPVYDQELISKAAEQSGFSKELLPRVTRREISLHCPASSWMSDASVRQTTT